MGFRRITICASLAVLSFYALLILSLAYFFEWDQVRRIWFSDRTLFTIKLSLAAATLAAVFALLLAVPAAYALSRFDFRGRLAADTILEFPIIVSPAALGAVLLIFFNNPLGEWIQAHLVTFVFSFAGVVLAQFVTVLGIATRFVKTALDEIPTEYERVARSLGAGPFRAFATTTLPLAKRGLFTAFVLSWAKAMGEFGATITVAGTMAMRTETLPVAIYMRLSTADIEGTVALILLLLFIGLGSLFLVRRVSRRRFHAET
ncbi:ABC transporter permease [Desulfosoma caldarium]|uniref:Molybdate transport system permease protein n=1 Tax=Desulfosoma caldarium TaxID=610254 RepID=A0A3N1URX7_9BACT|nr:ABC transporter permease [Desulfosoma caldarium]ROQ89836.1 molybdate transport system permease protein [Desulfosoma caldarium]